jgi:NAD(P)H-nitrite reductase large subunit
MERFAIVGFGCAGYHAIKAIREAGSKAIIDVYSNTDEPPANPMLTTYYVSGKISYDQLFPFGSVQDITNKYNVRVFQGEHVTYIDVKEKQVFFNDGMSKTYDKILICTGAKPFAPKIGTIPEERVFYMRTVEDAKALKSNLEERYVKKAVVVGASMVGIKVAEAFNNMGIKCVLSDISNQIFPTVAMREAAKEIEDRVSAKGIDLNFGEGISAITQTDKGIQAHFGENIVNTDIVVLSIGTQPNISIVDKEKIKIGKAIKVNSRMKTSVPGIFAAGDCSEGMDLQLGETRIIGLWANAGHQGRTAGYNMAGKQEEYHGDIIHNITHFMGMDFISAGDINAEASNWIKFSVPQR